MDSFYNTIYKKPEGGRQEEFKQLFTISLQIADHTVSCQISHAGQKLSFGRRCEKLALALDYKGNRTNI